MRIVTICAAHEALVDGVFEGHRKLTTDIDMAPIAKLRLNFREQEFRSCGFMYRVTLRARNVVERVRRPSDVGSRKALLMTTQAGIQDLAGPKLREGNNGRLAAVRLDVRFTRSVTTLATRIGRLLFSRSDALEVRILIKSQPHVWMAGFAHRASDKLVWDRFSGCNQAEKHDDEKYY